MKAIRINKLVMPVLVVLTLLGSVWVAKAAGLWQTSGRDQVILDESGLPDPAGIKGWMTLATVSETYGVPLDYLVTELGLPAGVNTSLTLRDVAESFGIEVTEVRDAVQRYQDGH